ncbi:MAG: type II toxin-antitoxin system RelE/ParE family toxin [Candidatus Bathyarchaeota archaeon]|nr:MAG: type II toxin-antitoxin system RelE/ParE family toxin [Candidatus Bathyarchaeota archaeon]
MFHVIISQKARKASKRLPKKYRYRIIELLRFFRENPVPAEWYDIKKLKGYTDTYRARIGDLRIIYEIAWHQKSVHILVIKRRENVYS